MQLFLKTQEQVTLAKFSASPPAGQKGGNPVLPASSPIGKATNGSPGKNLGETATSGGKVQGAGPAGGAAPHRPEKGRSQPPSPAPAAPASPPPAAPAKPAQPAPATLEETLLAIVSERTGYPSEVLDLQANLEADLGIDSIKRVEIIGAFRRTVLPSLEQPPREFMERMTTAKTLRAILDGIAELVK
jgi:acyl carrier protein